MSAQPMTDFRRAWERRLEVGAHDDVVIDLVEHALGELSGDELDVVGLVIDRLKLGRRLYGELDVEAEDRDLEAEAIEEAADGFVYVADLLLKVRRRRVALTPDPSPKSGRGENILQFGAPR